MASSSVKDMPVRKRCNRICSVPQCSNRANNLTGISLHSFPKCAALRKQWGIILRFGKGIPLNAVACSEHFSSEAFMIQQPNVLRRRLKINALPSEKIPLRSLDTPKKSESGKRRNERAKVRNSNVSSPPLTVSSEDDSFQANEGSCEARGGSSDMIPPEMMDAADGLLELSRGKEKQSRECQVDLSITFRQRTTFLDLLKSDKDVSTFTGLNSMAMLKAVTEGAEFVASVNNVSTTGTNFFLQEKVILCLVKLKQNMSFSALAVLFSVSVPTAVSYFHVGLHLLYFTLKRYVKWLPRETVRKNLPKCFLKFGSTRVVVDCTEVKVSTPTCLRCRINTYSHYKGGHTLKFMVGVTPDGVISYISKAYGGKASDKFIFLNSGVAELCETDDSVMADKGFFIEKECGELGVCVIKPPYLKKKGQFSKEEGELNACIARARVHVERAIQRMKVFQLLQGTIPWNMISKFDEILVVVSAIVNLSSPIIGSNGFN